MINNVNTNTQSAFGNNATQTAVKAGKKFVPQRTCEIRAHCRELNAQSGQPDSFAEGLEKVDKFFRNLFNKKVKK